MSILKGKDIQRPAKREAAYIRSMAQVIQAVRGLSPDNVAFDWFAHSLEAKAAFHMENGVYHPELSANAARLGGTVEGSRVAHVRVEAGDGETGGVFAQGKGCVEVDGAYISLSGDSTGIGGPASGAAVSGGGCLTVRNAVISASGLTHYATAAEQGGVLRVFDSVLISHGAPFANGEPQPTGPMQVPPPPLMIAGNSRTHCSLTGSQSYFYRSKILADGWGALSTEAAEGYVYIEANDCQVVTVRRGYAAYADPGSHVYLNRCLIDSADMAGIIGGEANMDFVDCDTRCGSVFMLMHSVFGEPEEISYVTVRGGRVRSARECFLIKSRNVCVLLEDTDIQAANGILIHSIINDDFLATPVGHDPYGAEITLKSMQAIGDIIHEDTQREMWLNLESAVLRGKIQNAHLAMDVGSSWFATSDSEVTLMGEIYPEQIDAPEGVTIRMYGAQSGRVVLRSGGVLNLIKG